MDSTTVREAMLDCIAVRGLALMTLVLGNNTIIVIAIMAIRMMLDFILRDGGLVMSGGGARGGGGEMVRMSFEDEMMGWVEGFEVDLSKSHFSMDITGGK